MDRKNMTFATPLFNQNGGNVEFELAIERERWMLKSFHQHFPRDQE